MKKKCCSCKKILSVNHFGNSKSRKDGLQTMCKLCRKTYDHDRHKRLKDKILKQKKERRKLIKEWFIDYKSNLECKNCGENHIACLVFHHINPKEKEYSISDMIRGFSIDKIKKEIEKCICLCSNCHRKLHWEEKQLVVG